MSDPDPDLILIGSGMGALTVGALMARLRGKRVLVLERHFRAGGFTHAFRRGPYSWDVGVHYIGEMGPRMGSRRLMDLVTGGEVEWTRMPEPYERFSYPGHEIELRSGRDGFFDAFLPHFPEEEAALRRYWRDIHRAMQGMAGHFMGRAGGRGLRALGGLVRALRPPRYHRSTAAWLEQHVRSPELAAALTSIWGDYGLPPSLAPFALHAMVAVHYTRGAWYPQGGAGRIVAAAVRAIEGAGGQVLLNRKVDEVLIEGGRAVGVRARPTRGRGAGPGSDANLEEHRAPVIVSNAGAANTWRQLVPEAHRPAFTADLDRFLDRAPLSTHVSAYLGLRQEPTALGMRGENHWLHRGYDHDAAWRAGSTWPADGQAPLVYLSFPSLKDPDAAAPTAEAVSICGDDAFARWRGRPWKNRGDDYEAFKQGITDALLDLVEERRPGFRELIDFVELSTPLTTEDLTGHHRGTIYGLPGTAARFDRRNAAWGHPRTPVPGLYQTGADAGSPGLMGALQGGLLTLSHLPGGVSMPQAIAASRKG